MIVVIERLLKRLIHLLLLLLAHTQWLVIGISPIRNRQTQRLRHSILFRFLDLPHLFSLPLAFFLQPLLWCEFLIVRFGVPVQIFVLLPSPDWCHERVAEIVLAVLRALDIVPGEVDTASRAFLANGLEEVHLC